MPDIEPIDPSEGKEGWKITDLAEADFAARTMLHYEAKIERLKAEYADALAKAVKACQHRADHKRWALLNWWIHQVEKDPDGDPAEPRTETLPCGVELRYRPQKQGDYVVVVKDEAELLAYATEHGLLNKASKPTVNKNAIKALMKDGKEVPGAYLDEPEWLPYQLGVAKGLVKLEGETADE
jgi:hypothetical protein